MQLRNSFVVPAPVDEAWRVLLDVARIAPCMPGARVDSVEGEDIHGNVTVKLGPIAVRYQGTITFVERDEHKHRAVLSAADTRLSHITAASIDCLRPGPYLMHN